jgi:hypothetical protein
MESLVNLSGVVTRPTPVAEQIVGRERRGRELIADFKLPIADLNSRRRVNSNVRRLQDR